MSNHPEFQFPNLQICDLKVNIHCHGCEKKVRRILKQIDGVYSTNIDAAQGKVTVVSDVDPTVLIKKLAKHNKPAKLLTKQRDEPNDKQQLQHDEQELRARPEDAKQRRMEIVADSVMRMALGALGVQSRNKQVRRRDDNANKAEPRDEGMALEKQQQQRKNRRFRVLAVPFVRDARFPWVGKSKKEKSLGAASIENREAACRAEDERSSHSVSDASSDRESTGDNPKTFGGPVRGGGKQEGGGMPVTILEEGGAVRVDLEGKDNVSKKKSRGGGVEFMGGFDCREAGVSISMAKKPSPAERVRGRPQDPSSSRRTDDEDGDEVQAGDGGEGLSGRRAVAQQQQETTKYRKGTSRKKGVAVHGKEDGTKANVMKLSHSRPATIYASSPAASESAQYYFNDDNPHSCLVM